RLLSSVIAALIAFPTDGVEGRNDQVATDIRLWLMDYLSDELLPQLRRLINTLVSRAESETGVLMPGYTHLQRTQPVRWSHWLLSYASMLRRDCQRLADCRARTAMCPLGSGALAGNPFEVDRQALADALGFTSGVTWNSLDAVADRDFASEFQFAAAMIGNHLSRLAEDLILFCSKEFGFVTLSDAYSTGSSLMPQKKNADSLELIRGKTGRLCGHLVSLLMVQKSLPSAFNKDLQEDKEGLFDSADTPWFESPTVHPEACAGALSCDMLATDLAYYLVRRGVPFREAHAASGRCVALAEAKACQLHQLTFEDFRTVSDTFGEEVTQLWDFETSVEQYGAFGGTALESVRQQVAAFRRWLGDEQK
uniref:Argininosuccinate lyase n=1 Tax=Macrostomum lignano TaxID=282301 RepID=A0A1I8FVQ4_9PLAT